MSMTHCSLNASQAMTSTPRAPRSDHKAASPAPVSELGNDGDAVIGGDLQDLARQLDGKLQLSLANGGAVRAAGRSVLQALEAPPRVL
jgi:hypothetical protein